MCERELEYLGGGGRGASPHKYDTNLVDVLIYFCCAALCPDPTDPVNGMVTFTGNSVSDTATYSCTVGFELVGSTTATCIQEDVNSAAFLPAPPVCRRK